jgi:myosin-1
VMTYLLEMSRLVYQVDGERNFHIFFQLLAGASAAARQEFRFTKPENNYYLNQSNCYNAEETYDRTFFEDVVRDMSCVGIDKHKQQVIFSVIAGLLHMVS